MSRLSVLTVTRNRMSRSTPIGCSAIEAAAPVWTFDDGHSSSGMRLSRTYAASRPSCAARPAARLDVVDDPHAVPEPVGPAPLDRLPDRGQAERLAGVDGEVEVLPVQVLERVQVPGGRVAGLGPGDVEADHADVAEPHGQLGDLGRAGGVAHRGQQRADPDRRARPPGPRTEPASNPASTASTTSGSCRPALEVLLRGEAHLGVDHAVRRRGPGRTPGPPGRAPRRSASPPTVWANVSR